ncbi:MAG: sulfatase-like hydrolase/transferase [bacterium]|nr:sulfatase-like hydrolase/transferase [bacterium]
MKPTNMLYIISDQHNYRVMGCYGNPVVQTPNLDRLAEGGTRFTNAYTNCAICVPVRAALAAGRYVHQIGSWDNAHSYDGSTPSWHHRLREQGFNATSIGKLHFKGQGCDHGFSEEIEPLNVVEGVGDLLGCIREDPPFRNKRPGIDGAGPGDSSYLQYDQRNADNGCKWLQEHQNDEKPWALFLSFVCPHPPYISPPEDFNSYENKELPYQPQWREADWPDHPAQEYFRRFFTFAPQFDEETIHKMNAAYYGVCTFLDRQIGRVLTVLEETGLTENTRIVYTTDHGEHLGGRGLYGKFTMYEEAAGIPFLMSGPDIPEGKVVNTPISLIDSFPTILETVGAKPHEEDSDLPGDSLLSIARDTDRDRTVFSEYHAVGTRNAFYMLRNQQYKYTYYVNDLPQLFDLDTDPEECNDLSASPDHQSVLQNFESQLREILDPEETDARAKADQQAIIDSFGGKEAVLSRGAFDNSPVPGEEPTFRKHGEKS